MPQQGLLGNGFFSIKSLFSLKTQDSVALTFPPLAQDQLCELYMNDAM